MNCLGPATSAAVHPGGLEERLHEPGARRSFRTGVGSRPRSSGHKQSCGSRLPGPESLGVGPWSLVRMPDPWGYSPRFLKNAQRCASKSAWSFARWISKWLRPTPSRPGTCTISASDNRRSSDPRPRNALMERHLVGPGLPWLHQFPRLRGTVGRTAGGGSQSQAHLSCAAWQSDVAGDARAGHLTNANLTVAASSPYRARAK